MPESVDPNELTVDTERLVRERAEAHGVDPDLAARIAKQESGFKQSSVSPKGAVGVMQLMPDTAKGLGVDPHDIHENVEGGVRYFKSLLDRYAGDVAKASAAYNAGPGRVDRGGPLPKETQDYVKNVTGAIAVDPDELSVQGGIAVDPSELSTPEHHPFVGPQSPVPGMEQLGALPGVPKPRTPYSLQTPAQQQQTESQVRQEIQQEIQHPETAPPQRRALARYAGRVQDPNWNAEDMQNLGVMLGASAVGEAAATATNPIVRRAALAISNGLGAYFAKGMVESAGQHGKEAYQAYKNGDYLNAVRMLGAGSIEAGFGVLGLKESLQHGFVLEPKESYQARQAGLPPSQRDIGAGGTRGPVEPEVVAPEAQPQGGLKPGAEPVEATAEPPAPPVAKGSTFDTQDGTVRVRGVAGDQVIFEKEADGERSVDVLPADQFRKLVGAGTPRPALARKGEGDLGEQQTAEPRKSVEQAANQPLNENGTASATGNHQTLPESQQAAEPSAAPSERESQTGLDQMDAGAAIADNMHAMLWDKVQRGVTSEAGTPSALLQVARLARGRGGIQTPEQLRDLANAYAQIKETGLARQKALHALVEQFSPAAEAPAPNESGPVPSPATTQARSEAEKTEPTTSPDTDIDAAIAKALEAKIGKPPAAKPTATGTSSPGVRSADKIEAGLKKPASQVPATGKEAPVVLQDFVAGRGGFANPAHMIIRSTREISAEEIRREFFPDYGQDRLQIEKLRADHFMGAVQPGRQPFRLQFADEHGRHVSVPEGIEERLGLAAGENYHAPARNSGKDIPGVTGQQITLPSVTFSGKNGDKVEIPLIGQPTPAEPTAAGKITTGLKQPEVIRSSAAIQKDLDNFKSLPGESSAHAAARKGLLTAELMRATAVDLGDDQALADAAARIRAQREAGAAKPGKTIDVTATPVQKIEAGLKQAPQESGPTVSTSTTQARSETEKKESPDERGPGWVGNIPTSEIHVDAPRFQFKANVGQGGAGDELRGVTKYDPEKAGVTAVWKDPADGKTYVVNGHHRVELAQRTKHPEMTVRYLDAKTAQEARMKGALINIAEGRGESTDAAKVFRDSGMTPEQLESEGVSLKGKIASEGLALSNLAQPIFEDVINGSLPVARGAVIGSGVASHADQKALYDLIQQRERGGKRLTNDQIEELIRLNGRTSTTTEEQHGLFGMEEMSRSLLPEKAEVSDYIRKQINAERKLFGTVATQAAAERLSEQGNVIRAGENKDVADRANQGMMLYDRLSRHAGDIDGILDRAAQSLAAGESAHEVKQRAYREVRNHLAAQVRKFTGVPQGNDRGTEGLGQQGPREVSGGQSNPSEASSELNPLNSSQKIRAGLKPTITVPRMMKGRDIPYFVGEPTSVHASAAKIEPISLDGKDAGLADAYLANPSAIELVHRILDPSAVDDHAALHVGGAHIDPTDVPRALTKISTAHSVYSQRDGTRQLMLAAEKAAQAGKSLVLVKDQSGVSDETRQASFEEEMNHARQAKAGPLSGHIWKSHVPFFKDPNARAAAFALRNRGYRNASDGQLAAEIGVRLMVPSRFEEMSLQYKQARSLGALYIRTLRKEYGRSETRDIAERVISALRRGIERGPGQPRTLSNSPGPEGRGGPSGGTGSDLSASVGGTAGTSRDAGITASRVGNPQANGRGEGARSGDGLFSADEVEQVQKDSQRNADKLLGDRLTAQLKSGMAMPKKSRKAAGKQPDLFSEEEEPGQGSLFSPSYSPKLTGAKLRGILNQTPSEESTESKQGGPGYWISPKGEAIPLKAENGIATHGTTAIQLTGKPSAAEASSELLNAGHVRVRGNAIEFAKAGPRAIIQAVEKAKQNAEDTGKESIMAEGNGHWAEVPLNQAMRFAHNPAAYLQRAGQRGSAPMLTDIAKSIHERFGNDAPKVNYSGLGGLQRTLLPGRNLAEVEQASRKVFEAALPAASADAITSTVLQSAAPAIVKALKGSDYAWPELRQYYIESRLRGIKQRWQKFAQQVEEMSDAEVEQNMQPLEDGSRSPFLALLSNIEGKRGMWKNVGQTAAALADSKDWPTLRAFLGISFDEAADYVASAMGPKQFDSIHQAIQNDPRVKEADRLYGSLIEKSMAQSHSVNEGIFSDALGPANRYYPLVPLNKPQTPGPGRRLPYRKPKNQSNAFATGLSEAYDPGMEALGKKLSLSNRANYKAALIQTMRDGGWMVPEGHQTDDGLVMTGPDGVEYKAVREEVAPGRTIIKDGKVTHAPAKFEVMPDFMNRGLKKTLAREPMDPNAVIRGMHLANMLATKGPMELVFHSAGVLGALYANTPFLGKSGLDKALSLPLVKWFGIRGKLFSIDPTTPENVAKLQEMAQAGAVPAKSGTVTYSKQYADETGAKRERLSFGPMLYGPKGVDARARILMYDIFKGAYPNGTVSDLHHFVNQIGNYTPEMQGAIESAVKKIGLGPFATAGMTRIVNSIQSFTGTGPQAGETLESKLWWWLTASAWIAAAAWYVSHKHLTGKYPQDDKRAQLFQIPVGSGNGWIDQYRHSRLGNALWGKGPEVGYLNMSFFDNPLALRGARAMGLADAFKARQLGANPGQMAEAAQKGIMNSFAHPMLGPSARATFVGATGEEPYITGMRDRGAVALKFWGAIPKYTKPGLPTFGARAWAATKQLNSFYTEGAENLGEATGFLAPERGKRGDWLMKTGANILAPGLIGTPSNPAKAMKAIREEQKIEERHVR